MKTHILQLEIHDDATSTRDKMGWAKSPRVLLVWPERGRILTRRLDLILLQRHGNELGVQLALVTRDAEVRFHAYQLGIPVFNSLRQAQRRPWRPPRRFRQPPSLREIAPPPETGSGVERREQIASLRPAQPRPLSQGIRLVAFSLGVLAVLTLAAVLAPSAHLHLSPRSEIQTVTLQLSADPELTSINLSGAVPAHWTQVIVEGRGAIDTTGKLSLSTGYASGQVQFTNSIDEVVAIPAGTIVRTVTEPPIRFQITQSGRLAAGPGQTVSLLARAIHPGTKGNLPAGRIRGIEGSIGTRVTVTNPQSMRGGAGRQVAAPGPADRQELLAQLSESLRQTALDEITANLSPGDLLVEDSVVARETLEETYEPELNEAADQLNLSLRLEFEGLVISAQDIHRLASAVLDANLTAGYSPETGTLMIQQPTGPLVQGDPKVGWKLQAVRQTIAQPSSSQAVQLILGLEPEEAKRRLAASFPLANPPIIELVPQWWPRLPVVPFRIEVNK